ncbi:MAG: hypothetical protein WBV83_23180 [Bradyrhizobium sp.]
MITTILAVITLWVLRWVDRIIPREHPARLIVTSDPSWNALEDIPRLPHAMKCHARFQEQRLNDVSQKADYTFELFWRQPEDRPTSRDLLALIGKQFTIKSFELITDNGR